MSFYTYILECADGTLYTGYTVDLCNRLKAHNSGKGARFTRARLPVRLAASWEFDTKSDAMRFEYELKQLPRLQKINLIHDYLASHALDSVVEH